MFKYDHQDSLPRIKSSFPELNPENYLAILDKSSDVNDLISADDERNSCFTLLMKYFIRYKEKAILRALPPFLFVCKVALWVVSRETLNTLERKNEQQQKLLAILRIEGYQTSQVVITGGEPYLYDLKSLTQLLEQKGYFSKLKLAALISYTTPLLLSEGFPENQYARSI